jgi:hypothetical protein
MSTTLPDVTNDDVPNHWDGDLEDFTPEYINGKLREVVGIIRSRYGAAVRRRLANGDIDDFLFKAIVVRVASRVWANTDGFKRENAGQYGYEVNAAVASGTIWFTDDDEFDLTGVHPKKSNVIGTATIGRHHPRRTR